MIFPRRNIIPFAHRVICMLLLMAVMTASAGAHVMLHSCGKSGVVKSCLVIANKSLACDSCCPEESGNGTNSIDEACCQTMNIGAETSSYTSRSTIHICQKCAAVVVRSLFSQHRSTLSQPSRAQYNFKFSPSHHNSWQACICIFLC